jgi:hypothetical protein
MHNYPMPLQVVGEPYDYGIDDEYVHLGAPASGAPAPQAGD